MPPTLSLVLNQIISSLTVLQTRNARLCAGLMLAMTWIGAATAPDVAPGATTWTGLFLIALLSTLAVTVWVASRQTEVSPENRQYRRTAAVTLGAIALLLNLFFSVSSTFLLAIALVLIAREAAQSRPDTFPWPLCATLAILVPWWTWAALGTWTPALLVLLPLAALAWLSAGHILEAYRLQDDDARSPLSMRGHRLGAWMGMLLAGILVVIAGLIAGASNAWIALGGILMAVAVAMEAGISRPEDNPGKHAAAICNGAFLTVAICWLIGLN